MVIWHTISIICLHLWYMLGGSVRIQWIVGDFWFIEGQSHSSTSWRGKMSLTRNELIYNILHSNLYHYLLVCTKILPIWKVLYPNDQFPPQSRVELRGYFYWVIWYRSKKGSVIFIVELPWCAAKHVDFSDYMMAAHLDFRGCSFATNLLTIKLLSQYAEWQRVHSYILVKFMRYEQFHW